MAEFGVKRPSLGISDKVASEKSIRKREDERQRQCNKKSSGMDDDVGPTQSKK